MTPAICGNCTHYARTNAWSGSCSLDEQHRSPGMPCTISKFEPLPSMRESKPAGSYPQALLRSDISLGTYRDGALDFVPWPPQLVEVLSIVGEWAMVRWVPQPVETLPRWSFDSPSWHLDPPSTPFVVEAVRLDFGTSRQ
jgi:hypothetical protein